MTDRTDVFEDLNKRQHSMIIKTNKKLPILSPKNQKASSFNYLPSKPPTRPGGGVTPAGSLNPLYLVKYHNAPGSCVSIFMYICWRFFMNLFGYSKFNNLWLSSFDLYDSLCVHHYFIFLLRGVWTPFTLLEYIMHQVVVLFLLEFILFISRFLSIYHLRIFFVANLSYYYYYTSTS